MTSSVHRVGGQVMTAQRPSSCRAFTLSVCMAGALVLAACGAAADDDDGSGSVGSAGDGGANAGTAGASAGTGGADAGTGGASAGSVASGTGGDTAAGAGGVAGTGAGGGAGAGGDGGAGAGGAPATGGDSGAVEAAKSAGCGTIDALKSGRASIDVSGTTREYILKVPDGYDPNRPYKLIFAWHWRGGSADDVASGSIGGGPYYGLEARAADTAIFVAPEGIDAGFANTDGRDIAFARAVLALFDAKLCIDRERIFSTGFSYGGMMSDAIGCEMADVFRAIAPMSGGLPSAEHDYSGCNQVNSHPIAVWMSHGTSDLVVPFADGENARDLFVARNQCQSQTSAVEPSPCVAYQGCSAGYPVHWCEFSGGHTAPTFASAAIWDFFSEL